MLLTNRSFVCTVYITDETYYRKYSICTSAIKNPNTVLQSNLAIPKLA